MRTNVKPRDAASPRIRWSAEEAPSAVVVDDLSVADLYLGAHVCDAGPWDAEASAPEGLAAPQERRRVARRPQPSRDAAIGPIVRL